MEKGIIAIAAAIAVWEGFVTGINEAKVAMHAVDGIAKNPEAANEIRSMAFIGAAVSETCAIYGLLVALLIIFVLGA